MSDPAVDLRFLSSDALYGDLELDDPAEVFHECSKNYKTLALSRPTPLHLALQAQTFKPNSEIARKDYSHLPTLALPREDMSSLTMPLGESINRRASARAGFGTGVLSLEQLSLLLAATYGSLPESQRRSVPSGGALYPLSVYVAVLGRAEIAPGIYWHDPVAHTLATIETHDPTSAINEAMISPSYVEGASAIVIVTAMFWRSRFKYGERGYRYVLLEAGHAMQNLLLAATASSIPALPLGGFFDDVIERLLRIDGVDEGVLYTCALGTSS